MSNTPFLKNRIAGLTLVETLIGCTLFGGLLLLAGKSLLQITQQTSMINEKLDLESRTFALSRHLVRVIKFSENCVSTLNEMNMATVPPTVITPGGIQCSIVMETPRTVDSVPTTVQFIPTVVNNQPQVEFQTQQPGGAFITTLTYPNISRFVICNDTDMVANCPIVSSHPDLPAKINTVHVANIAAPGDTFTPAGHFFHFFITAVIPQTLETGGNNLAAGFTVNLQGAAYQLNNPVIMLGLAALNPLAFESGGKVVEDME